MYSERNYDQYCLAFVMIFQLASQGLKSHRFPLICQSDQIVHQKVAYCAEGLQVCPYLQKMLGTEYMYAVCGGVLLRTQPVTKLSTFSPVTLWL